jgi:hypothetical protein
MAIGARARHLHDRIRILFALTALRVRPDLMAAPGLVNGLQDFFEADDHIRNTPVPFYSAGRQCCRDQAIAIARMLILLSHCFLPWLRGPILTPPLVERTRKLPVPDRDEGGFIDAHRVGVHRGVGPKHPVRSPFLVRVVNLRFGRVFDFTTCRSARRRTGSERMAPTSCALSGLLPIPTYHYPVAAMRGASRASALGTIGQ